MTPDEAIDVLDTWLREVFLPQMPAHSLVVIGVVVRRRDARLGGDLIVNVAPTPEHRRASAAVAQEGERWLITLAGYFGDHPPTDEQDFLEFARNLPVPEIHEIAHSAEPLSEPATTASGPTSAGATRGWSVFPKAFSSSATPSAASRRSTDRACRWRPSKRSRCATASR